MRDLVNDDRTLICRIRGGLCALPVTHVVETMRPLPVAAVAGAPDFVAGVAIIRGNAVPVVDAARLLTAEGELSSRPRDSARRYVVVNAGRRAVALAVDEVVGVRTLSAAARASLPRLLSGTGSKAIASMGALDTELVLVLQSTHLLPDGATVAVPS